MFYDDLFKRANELYLAGALKQAEDLYRKILVVSPEHPDVLNMLGLIAQAEGKHAVAEDFFRQALAKLPKAWAIWFNLGISEVALKKYDLAERHYQTVLDLNPNLKEVYQQLVGVYELTGRTQEALEACQKVLVLDSSDIVAAVDLARLTGDVDALKSLAQQYPTEAYPAYHLALVTYRQGDFNRAEKAVQNALSVCCDSPEINTLAAKIYLMNHRKDLARACFRVALVHDPNNIEALGQAAALEKDESLFRKALDLEPDNANLHTAYADFLAAEGRTVEALEAYRKAVILCPDSVSVSNNLALILKDTGEYEQALDLFFNAFTKDTKRAEIAQNIAQMLLLLHDEKPETAHRIAKRWVQTTPDNVWATHTLDAFEGRLKSDDGEFTALLFDAFAPTYEQTMKRLNYRLLDELKEFNDCFSGRILDIGCGTGLVGQALKNASNTLTGVDVSKEMLRLAKQKRIYGDLHCTDIASFLKQNQTFYDTIIAFDVFNYMPHPAVLWPNLKGSRLLFTIENAGEGVDVVERMPNGRYRHNPTQIEKTLLEADCQVIAKKNVIVREEKAIPVEGTLFYVRLSESC